VRVDGACHTVGGGLRSGAALVDVRLRSGAALVDVRLDVVPLQPSSSSPTVAGCQLGGYPAGRDLWGGERIVWEGCHPALTLELNRAS
jgi:hypothetical protein